MTAPIWMAAPPEVHSALLSSGPGPGPLLAAAAAWDSLSAEYAEAAADLSVLVAAVQAGAWEGPGAESYAAAHAPYLAWLEQAATNAAARASQQEIAASAYTAALAAMPSAGELAANHATHAALLATNFFGINTIPIALNEADYVRMWIQAATTMGAYQAVSTAAVTASPHPTAAPAIVKANPAATPSDPFSRWSAFLDQVGQILSTFGGGGDDQSLISYVFSVPPGTNPVNWFVDKISVLSSPTSGYPAILEQLVNAADGDPLLIALAYLFGGTAIGYDLTIQVLQFIVTFPYLSLGAAPLLAAPAALAGLVGLGVGGVVGVAELAAHLPTGGEPIPAAPIAPGSSPAPSPVSASAAPASAHTAPVSALGHAAAAPASAPAAASAPGAPPPPSATAGPYLVGASTSMESRASAKASARRKAPEPDIAAVPAAAAASARDKARERRRRRAKVDMLGRGYAYMDLDDDDGDNDRAPAAAPDNRGRPVPAAAPDSGAGTLGFTGTTRREDVAAAAGLTTLAGDAFGGCPKKPMMPSTWAPHTSGNARGHEDGT
jgi:PPE-repeat protein